MSKPKTVQKKKEVKTVVVKNLDNVVWAGNKTRQRYDDDQNIALLTDALTLTTEQMIDKYKLKKGSLYARQSILRKKFFQRAQEGDTALLEKLQNAGLLVDKV